MMIMVFINKCVFTALLSIMMIKMLQHWNAHGVDKCDDNDGNDNCGDDHDDNPLLDLISILRPFS